MNVLRAFFIMGAFAIAAWSQSNVGYISGSVTDSTGTAVPNCAVTATHTQTGQKQTVSTQDTGLYVFASLDAASRRSVDFILEVGTLAESYLCPRPQSRYRPPRAT